MRFCIRREISFDNSEERLRKVKDVPIELALPPKLDDFMRNRHLLMDVKRQLKEFRIPVRSVHAPHGHLADETFKSWAQVVIGFAESVGSEIVVFHPEKQPEETRKDLRTTALLNVKQVQDRTRVTVALETFWDEGRVLTPDEIMEHHLPMVLDTSLVPKPEIIWIIESYRTHLVNVHLSAVTQSGGRNAPPQQFRPVDSDPFCLDVLDRLYELKWNGEVTLEYMPWLASKSVEDRKLLERIYQYQHNTTVPDLA